MLRIFFLLLVALGILHPQYTWGTTQHDFQTPSQVIHLLVNGNYHLEPNLKTANLFQVEATFFESLKEEVLDIVQENIPLYIRSKERVISWNKSEGDTYQYSLLNRTGKYNDFSLDHNHSTLNKKFHDEERYPYIQTFLSLFPHATNFRIHVIEANSNLSQRRENICFFHSRTKQPILTVRFYLPIETNSKALVFLKGHLHHFDEGNVYFFHNGMNYALENHHLFEDCVYLVWDMLFTEKTYQDMFQRNHPIEDILIPSKDIKVPIVGPRGINPTHPVHKRIPYERAQETRFAIPQ